MRNCIIFLSIFLFSLFMSVSGSPNKSVAQHVLGPYVTIDAENALGSGVIIGRYKNVIPDTGAHIYYVLTAYHVVDEVDRDNIQVRKYNSRMVRIGYQSFKADIVAINHSLDIVLLSFISNEELAMSTESRTTPDWGETVWGASNPVGLYNIVTKGSLASQTDYLFRSPKRIILNIGNYYGDSGGAIFDSNFNLIGIRTDAPVDRRRGDFPLIYLSSAVRWSAIQDWLLESKIKGVSDNE